MFLTVSQQPLREDRSTQKEEYQLANGLRVAANLNSRTRVELTTAGTGVYTTIWTSDDMPEGAAWALDISAIGVATLNSARYERASFYVRAVGGPPTAPGGGTADYIPPFETDPFADAQFVVVGNAIAVQVRDPGGGGAMDWDVVVTAREVT